ncbi:DUF1476 domain-containing protein [Magnetovibrio blakemorei]|uniref:Aldolase n=1 Tax=Magnetovibrio blakemorei TaxID=28181 RepID=A0A1E5Q5E2_9PROT|nr:DUF1476 domain-containing protein [Magnetovibrio blakemorei]OEJ65084.1 hypothetical protein BEN30_15465 [Magnetovibrio blakemorei]
MNTLFNGRELAFEAKLKCDQDLKFHAQALSNMRFGVWLGGKLGLSTEECEAYGHELVDTRLNAMVREEMIKKIMNDLAERHADINEDEVHKALDRFYADALKEVTCNGE